MITLSLISNTRTLNGHPAPLSKTFELTHDGVLTQTNSAKLLQGLLEVMRLPIDEAIALIDTLKPHQALCVGVPKNKATKFVVVTSAKYDTLSAADRKHTIPRTTEHIIFSSEPCLMVLDIDSNERCKLPESAEDLANILFAAIPCLDKTDLYIRPSTSSNIYNTKTNTQLRGVSGYHVLMALRDGFAMKAIGELLEHRLWLAGKGYIKITKDGRGFASTMLDSAVWEPTRLIYNAAGCDAGLDQRKDPIKRFEGLTGSPDGFIGLSDFEALTHSELARVAQLKQDALTLAKPEMTAKRDVWLAAQIAGFMLANPDATEEEIARAKKGFASSEKGLSENHIIYFTDRLTPPHATVATIKADLDQYHGRECKDPMEPDYNNGAQVGKLYLENPTKPYIKSQAHGGQTFNLYSQAEIKLETISSFDVVGSDSLYTPTLDGTNARHGTTDTHPLTESGNAQRLLDMMRDKVRYVAARCAWLIHDDGRWSWNDGSMIREAAMTLHKIIYAEGLRHMRDADCFGKWALKSQDKKTIVNEVSLLSDLNAVRLEPSLLDNDDYVVGFNGGRQKINLKNGTISNATPTDYITKSLAVTIVGEASMAIRWVQFLNEIFKGDAELIEWLRRYFGYMLTGSTKEHKFLFFHGDGRNGKSVLIDTLAEIMGDYSCNTPPETLSESVKPSGGTNSAVIALKGKRLVFTTETREGAPLAEELVKGITAGDTISARDLHSKQEEFTPNLKLVMLGNYLPTIRGLDNGIWDRFFPIPFTARFINGDRDLNLKDKLLAEAPHILAWLVQGCIDWQLHGLGATPSVITVECKGYRTEQDVVGLFLTDCVQQTQNSKVLKKDVYLSFSSWFRENGYTHIIGGKSFSNRLQKRGYVTVKSDSKTYWRDMGLIGDWSVSVGDSDSTECDLV